MKSEERIYRNSETSEKSLERKLVEKMKALGCMALKMNDVMHCGMPDRLVVLPGGRVVWAEMKSLGKKVTALQESRIRELRRRGHVVFVIDTPELLEEFVKLIESELR